MLLNCLVTFCRELQREKVAAEEALSGPVVSKDYSLKQGEKITIKINRTRKGTDTNETDDGEADTFGTKPSASSGAADLLGSTASSGYVTTPLVAVLAISYLYCGSGSGWETF